MTFHALVDVVVGVVDDDSGAASSSNRHGRRQVQLAVSNSHVVEVDAAVSIHIVALAVAGHITAYAVEPQ